VLSTQELVIQTK